MNRPLISLVVAMAENSVIGNNNALPWRLPDDLRRFKALTWGKPILMGRRTFESIGKPLPGRLNLVLTRNWDWKADGVTVVHSMEEALCKANADAEMAGAELAVIGGADLFRMALPYADVIHLTRVHGKVPGDTIFPELDPQEWNEVTGETHPADERHEYSMTFSTLQRAGVRRALISC